MKLKKLALTEFSETPRAGAGRTYPKELIEYLRTARVFIASPGIVRDVINPSVIAGSGSILTDGVWAWDDQIVHYVEKYGFELPEEFVRHAQSNGVPPQLTRQILLRLEL